MDYKPLEEIHHTFQASPRHPNYLVTYAFLALLSLATGLYLLSACSLGNSNKLLVSGLFTQLSFWATLLLWVALLTAFWVCINLKQFLSLALVLSILTILMGDKALIRLQ